MRDLPHSLTGDAATLALCWRIMRRDGVVLGFTQHDADVVFGGVLHQARSGLDVEAARSLAGFGGSETVVLGALVCDSVTLADILAGLYDHATIETWLADWSDPAQSVLIDCGSVGRIEASDHGFKVEVRSVIDQLMQPQGRLFQAHCSADLGDERCGLALSGPSFRLEGVVRATDGRSTLNLDAGGFAADHFSRGVLQVLDGANAGMRVDIKTHDVVSGQAQISLWQSFASPLNVGDRVVAVVGCDKTAGTCQTRFGNIANFRGFPRMPGNDLLLRRVNDGEAGMDGESLFQ